MPNPKYLQPQPGLTSVQAAALYLSDGKTDDPEEAVHYNATGAGADGFQMDELQKAHLRRMMGFNFEVKLKHKKITVYSTETPYVMHETKYSGIMNEKTVDKIVDACATLKELYEEQVKELEEEAWKLEESKNDNS